MDTPPTDKTWRINAAAIIMDTDGYVLLGKDNGRNPYWHFPQGGVIKMKVLNTPWPGRYGRKWACAPLTTPS